MSLKPGLVQVAVLSTLEQCLWTLTRTLMYSNGRRCQIQWWTQERNWTQCKRNIHPLQLITNDPIVNWWAHLIHLEVNQAACLRWQLQLPEEISTSPALAELQLTCRRSWTSRHWLRLYLQRRTRQRPSTKPPTTLATHSRREVPTSTRTSQRVSTTRIEPMILVDWTRQAAEMPSNITDEAIRKTNYFKGNRNCKFSKHLFLIDLWQLKS